VEIGRKTFLEAMKLVRTNEVHLACGDGLVTGDRQVMAQSWLVGMQHRAVIVTTDTRNVLARLEASPSRSTDGTGRIGIVKTHTFLNQAVQVRRLDDGMPVCSRKRSDHLVAHDHQDIRLLCHCFLLP